MKKLAILNNKGGVGKSTVSVQLAHGLAKLGFRVILLDLDGQNDSSLFLGISESDYRKTFYDLIDKRNKTDIRECIISARENLDLIPNSNIEEINAEFYRESRIDLVLSEKLIGLEDLDYDYLLIDCGPKTVSTSLFFNIWISLPILSVEISSKVSMIVLGMIILNKQDNSIPTTFPVDFFKTSSPP